jgi:RNA polymerase sigma factor (sigma-70 family)
VTFQSLADHDLHRLSDEQLIDYLRAARAAGDAVAGRRALAFLIYGYERDVQRRLALKVPAHVVSDVAHDALVRAIAAAFDGRSQGEFSNWLHTIVDRTAADYHRRAARRPKESRLPIEHRDEDGVGGPEASTEDESAAVELRILVDQVIAEFNPTHQRVIELHVFSALPASQVCDRIDGMSKDNVAQIASRFRARLRDRLDRVVGAAR